VALFPTDTSRTLNNTECGEGLLIGGGCDNPFGKLYRIKISKTDPTSSCTVELVLAGSTITGGAFDNVLVTRSGHVLLLEDTTPTMLSEFLIPQSRYSQIIQFNPVNGEVKPIWEVDYAALQPNDLPYSKHMSHSGIVEFGDASNPLFLIALQGAAYTTPGDDNPEKLKIFSGQLTIFHRRDFQAVTPANQAVSFGVIQPRTATSEVVCGSSNNGGLIAALVVGWVVAGVMVVVAIAILVFQKRRPIQV